VVALIRLGAGGFYIATDPVTDRIYAQARPLRPGIHVAVINGQTNAVAATITGVNPAGVATDPRTDTIYATEPGADGPGQVYVINGQTNTVYVTNTGSRSVSVLAGAG
jgi:DNA-binding beta-propeller fold protein YncE